MPKHIAKIAWLLVFLGVFANADVVKPALVEVSIFDNNEVRLTINLSLEAAMSGISTKYKNTQDAPNAAKYDELRALRPAILRQKFSEFEEQFGRSIKLSIDDEVQKLTLKSAKIDIIGYKKRPRKTVLTYTSKLKKSPKTMLWKYHEASGDSAFRWQIYQPDQYNWSAWRWLRDGASSDIIKLGDITPVATLTTISQFITIGFKHVLPKGFDHILFIVGMALSSLLWRKLLLLITAFTLAHTLTLGLAMFGIVDIPARIVEPLIALSIAYVAIENLLPHQSIKRKTILVFAFGLVHGLGFATILQEFEMTKSTFLTSLISFNIGVELAQIVIVSVVIATLITLKKAQLNIRKLAIIPISILISLIGFFWAFERIIG